MKTFVCKEPKKAKVLQDYACRVKKIHDLTGAYVDEPMCPYVKATGFFERSTFFLLNKFRAANGIVLQYNWTSNKAW